MSDSDETTPFEFNLDSDSETETVTRKQKRHSYCKDRHSTWAILCGAVVIVALLAFVGLAVRISKTTTQESTSDPHDTQEGSGELPSDPLERALALLCDYPVVDG